MRAKQAPWSWFRTIGLFKTAIPGTTAMHNLMGKNRDDLSALKPSVRPARPKRSIAGSGGGAHSLHGANRLWTDRRGTTAIEYALLCALLSTAIIGPTAIVGYRLVTVFQRVPNASVVVVEEDAETKPPPVVRKDGTPP